MEKMFTRKGNRAFPVSSISMEDSCRSPGPSLLSSYGTIA